MNIHPLSVMELAVFGLSCARCPGDYTGSGAYMIPPTNSLQRPETPRLSQMFRRAGSRGRSCFAAILAIGLIVSSAQATPAASPQGTWLTTNGDGVVKIAQCGDALCGEIVGIDRKATAPMPTDMHGRPQCGLTIISNERLKADGTWLGDITDPRDGSMYQAMLWVDERGDLHLRAFIGIPALGATVIWRPFTGHLTAKCGLA
jgi:uncharacterized protein (DUF2147 family)